MSSGAPWTGSGRQGTAGAVRRRDIAFVRLAELRRALRYGLLRTSATERMRREWEERAASPRVRYYVHASHSASASEFFESGREDVERHVLPLSAFVCPEEGVSGFRTRAVQEIGCGAGRLLGPLADIFGEVHGIDISAGMLAQAGQHLGKRPNVYLHLTDGTTLSGIESGSMDVVVSMEVFGHMPSVKVVESCLHEVARVLRPGGIARLQFEEPGGAGRRLRRLLLLGSATWVGVRLAPERLAALIESAGFEVLQPHGADRRRCRLVLGHAPAPARAARAAWPSRRDRRPPESASPRWSALHHSLLPAHE